MADMDLDEDGVDIRTRVRFLYGRRRAILRTALVIAVLGTIVAVALQFRRESRVVGVVSLSFTGIDAHEYPNKARFDQSELVAPDVLSRAIAAANLGSRVTAAQVAAGIALSPVVPQAIMDRWQSLRRANRPVEPYLATAFEISMKVPGLTTAEATTLFNAIVAAFRESARDRMAPPAFALASSMNDPAVVKTLDYWVLPAAYAAAVAPMDRVARDMVRQTSGERVLSAILPPNEVNDARAGDEAADLVGRVRVFLEQDLAALTSVTLEFGVAREPAIQRALLEARRRDVASQRARQLEMVEAYERLLPSIQRPPSPAEMARPGNPATPAAAQPVTEEDAFFTVVNKVLDLRPAVADSTVRLANLDVSIAALRGARSFTAENLPPAYVAVLTRVTTAFDHLIKAYQAQVTRYVDKSTVTKVQITAGPSLVDEGRSSILTQIAVILLLAIGGGVLIVALNDVVRQSLAGDRAKS